MSKAVLIFAVSLAAAVLAIGGGRFATPNIASAATCPAGASTGLSVQTMTSGGVQRSYRLYLPTSYDASTPLPLVLNFHGFSSNAWQQERYSGFIDIAEREGFVLVTPDGTSTPRRWYIYGKWERGYVDDFAFTEDLIDEVSASICIDQARVYATGISNGAAMSSLLGCKSDRIAAIGPVAGSPYSALLCRNAGPVPVIAFHGTDDALVPFDGGNGGRLGLPVTPVRENMLGWAEHNGCDLTLQTERIASDVVLERYTNCDEGADVLLYVIEGGGHTWPGARDVPWLGNTTHSISASELIWSFFEAH
jgi:polyhydroxybutyrate depolymerase